MEGVHRFLARAWRLFEGGVVDEEPTREQLRLLHQTIKKVCVKKGWDGAGRTLGTVGPVGSYTV